MILFSVLAVGAAAPVQAAEEPRDEPRLLRVCDPTACYVAWSVVDSDSDGVCDADEILAGTDPRDPASRPGLELIAELLQDRKLPSFEYGLAALVAFPAEIMALREKLGVDLLGAFPMNKRADALTRMGISGDLLAEMGVSVESGFSLGLDHPKPGSSTVPGPRVAGLGVNLISAGSTNGQVSRGGVVSSSKNMWGDTVTKFGDGSKDTTTKIDHGIKTTTTNADGSKGNTTTKDGGSWKQDGITVVVKNESTANADGTELSSSSSVAHILGDGSISTLTTTKESILDGDGKVVGVIITESLDYMSADGNFSSHAETRSACDASGQQCSERSNYTETKNKYIDPEYAYGNMVSQEVVDGVLRTQGAAVTVVAGWTAPGAGEDPKDPHDRGTVMLVDDTTGNTFLLLEPEIVTEAQPEGHPGLPNPNQGWSGPPPGEGCEGLC